MIALFRLKHLSKQLALTSTVWDEMITSAIDYICANYTIKKRWWYCFNKDFRLFVNERLKWYEEGRC